MSTKPTSLPRLAEKELIRQLRTGQSRHEAKIREGIHDPEGIFSYNTFRSYEKHCRAFCKWVKSEHPECRTLKDALEYVPDYLKMRIDRGLSSYTVHLDASALAKLYHCQSKDFGVKLPSRERKNITRSRGSKTHDKHFSEKNNRAVVDFCRGTGLRRHELKALKVGDVAPDGSWVRVRRGKGGKPRTVPVLPAYQKHVAKCVADAKGKSVFESKAIKQRMDVHSYRREYANALYRSYVRNLKTLSNQEKYFCRKDKAGIVYDREAMLIVSRALGHNRIDVIAEHYLD